LENTLAIFADEQALLRSLHKDDVSCECPSCAANKATRKIIARAVVPQKLTGGVAWLIATAALADLLTLMKNDDQRDEAINFLNKKLASYRKKSKPPIQKSPAPSQLAVMREHVCYESVL
jgi:hypothetical protein